MTQQTRRFDRDCTADPAARRRSSPAFERRLVLAAAGGEPRARQQLVDAFTPLIAGVARTYRGSTAVDRTELMQEGVVGLLRALQRYDSTQGTPFWAYASWWVRQAMQQLVAEMTRPVVLSDRALRQLARVKDARRRALQSRGRDPSNAEIADATGFSVEHVDCLVAAESMPRALEEPLRGDEGAPGVFGDLLSDPSAEDEYEQVDRRLETEELRRLPDQLGERERAVVRAHYGLDRPAATLREIAGDLGLSAERVRQIEQRAFEKLRDAAGTGSPA